MCHLLMRSRMIVTESLTCILVDRSLELHRVVRIDGLIEMGPNYLVLDKFSLVILWDGFKSAGLRRRFEFSPLRAIHLFDWSKDLVQRVR